MARPYWTTILEKLHAALGAPLNRTIDTPDSLVAPRIEQEDTPVG
jgi:hypothetical protein